MHINEWIYWEIWGEHCGVGGGRLRERDKIGKLDIARLRPFAEEEDI